MNNYMGDSRYEKVWEQMKLLGIQDVSTKRHDKNGTITWKLPIKNNWPGNQKNATCIEVGSFASGMVRNNNSGYSNYQLNKCEPNVEYWPDHEWKTLDNGDYTQVKTGNSIQIMSSEDAKRIAKMTQRRGYGTMLS